MSKEREEKMLEQVRKIVKEHPDGLTISEIAKEIGVSRQTARIFLARLEGEGCINVRKIGPAKLITYKRGEK